MKRHIDLINAYLNKTLTKTERQVFENKLNTDDNFNTIYNEQLIILEGIKRVAIKKEITIAKQSYLRAKWLKYTGIYLGVILVSALIYSLIFKNEEPQVTTQQNNNTIKIEVDSIVVKKAIEEKIVIIEDIEKPIFSKAIIEQKHEITRPDKTVQNNTPTIAIVNTKVMQTQEKLVNKLNEDIIEPISPEILAFYKTNKKAPQIIEVNTEKEFNITCNEGTILNIPAKSFVDAKTGELARGKINLEVTEYYKLSHMLLGNLTTTSDSKLLETGGMLFLEANKKGSKLKLKSGRRIKMVFNNKGKKDMQLFLGNVDNNRVNWKPENNSNIKFISDHFEELEEDVEVSFAIIDEAPIFKGCEGKNEDRKRCMKTAIGNFMTANYNIAIAKNLGLTGVQKINMFITINKDGTIGKISATAQRTALANEAIRVLESLPKLKPGMQRGRAVKTTFYLPFVFSLNGKTVNQAGITVNSDRNFVGDLDINKDSTNTSALIFGIKSKSNKNIERYAFASSKLGWINCDRFAKTTSKKVKYKLKIKDAEGANVKMIFKSISSILPSNKRNGSYEFGWVPKNEAVVLIAIKWKENNLYLGKKETNTASVLNQDFDMDFKEITFKALTKEIQKIDFK